MAEAYRLSAMALETTKVRIGHADSPIRFLYYHALKLYLKALLRQKHNVEMSESVGGLLPWCRGLGADLLGATTLI